MNIFELSQKISLVNKEISRKITEKQLILIENKKLNELISREMFEHEQDIDFFQQKINLLQESNIFSYTCKKKDLLMKNDDLKNEIKIISHTLKKNQIQNNEIEAKIQEITKKYYILHKEFNELIKNNEQNIINHRELINQKNQLEGKLRLGKTDFLNRDIKNHLTEANKTQQIEIKKYHYTQNKSLNGMTNDLIENICREKKDKNFVTKKWKKGPIRKFENYLNKLKKLNY